MGEPHDWINSRPTRWDRKGWRIRWDDTRWRDENGDLIEGQDLDLRFKNEYRSDSRRFADDIGHSDFEGHTLEQRFRDPRRPLEPEHFSFVSPEELRQMIENSPEGFSLRELEDRKCLDDLEREHFRHCVNEVHDPLTGAMNYGRITPKAKKIIRMWSQTHQVERPSRVPIWVNDVPGEHPPEDSATYVPTNSASSSSTPWPYNTAYPDAEPRPDRMSTWDNLQEMMRVDEDPEPPEPNPWANYNRPQQPEIDFEEELFMMAEDDSDNEGWGVNLSPWSENPEDHGIRVDPDYSLEPSTMTELGAWNRARETPESEVPDPEMAAPQPVEVDWPLILHNVSIGMIQENPDDDAEIIGLVGDLYDMQPLEVVHLEGFETRVEQEFQRRVSVEIVRAIQEHKAREPPWQEALRRKTPGKTNCPQVE
jgi:hypothetical protein